ncbi:MAG TPA: aminotransferase class I/II-fold pyridoxal phosphate-dependent enzyme [Actinomycetes bacterium]
MRFSRAVQEIPQSGIREVMELSRSVEDAIHLEVGDPSFPTPPHVVEAAARAARDGWTRYVPSAGIPALRGAIADKLRKHNGVEVEPGEVIVTAGGIGAVHTAMAAVLEPGDEILLPDPAWPNFRMIAGVLHARERLYPLRAERGFLPEVEDLERVVGPRSRAVLVNSPSNPLGTIVPAERLRELAEFAERHDLWLIADECYDQMAFDDTFASAAAVGDPGRVLGCYTFSKTYAMTGWRVGYLAGPPAAAPLGDKLQQALVSCVNAPAQMAALAALTGPQDAVAEMRETYRERRDAVLALLAEHDTGCPRPAGAFYAWIDVRGRAPSAHRFAVELLRQQRVAVAPGTAFGPAGEGWVRISLATDTDLLLEGTRRLARFSM